MKSKPPPSYGPGSRRTTKMPKVIPPAPTRDEQDEIETEERCPCCGQRPELACAWCNGRGMVTPTVAAAYRKEKSK